MKSISWRKVKNGVQLENVGSVMADPRFTKIGEKTLFEKKLEYKKRKVKVKRRNNGLRNTLKWEIKDLKRGNCERKSLREKRQT